MITVPEQLCRKWILGNKSKSRELVKSSYCKIHVRDYGGLSLSDTMEM